MQAAEHVLHHLRDTWNESITYSRGSRNPNELWGWVDADWAGDTYSPLTHWLHPYNSGRPISWKSRCQDNIFLSASEAEFVAACHRARGFLFSWNPQRFGHQQQNAIEIYKDNLTYVVVGKNPVRRKFSRHIDIHRYFVHELI